MNPITHSNALVSVYKSHRDANSSVVELQNSGFGMRNLSVIGRDYNSDEDVVGCYNLGDRLKYWGSQGVFWGGVWGWLFGSAFLFIPGVGPLVFAGPIVGWIIGALEGAAVVVGLSALGAALLGMGIPKSSVLKFETALKTGKFIVIAHGTAEEVEHARAVMDRSPAEATEHHQISGHDLVDQMVAV